MPVGIGLAIAAALSACDGGSQGANAADNTATQSAPVALPPPIKESRTYRCKDNSVVSADFLADDVTANLRTDAGMFRLQAAKKGDPFKGDSQTLVAEESSITLTEAGKEALHCKA